MVTRETRISQTGTLAKELNAALRTAKAAETHASIDLATREELWREVANAAGQIQRRARKLGGLSRGG